MSGFRLLNSFFFGCSTSNASRSNMSETVRCQMNSLTSKLIIKTLFDSTKMQKIGKNLFVEKGSMFDVQFLTARHLFLGVRC